jgi:hypothetical protein
MGAPNHAQETVMTLIQRAAAAAALACLGIVPALAQTEPQEGQPHQHQGQWQNQTPEQRAQRMAERFKAADTNHDGKLSLEEAKAGMPMVARNFDKIDTAHTGSVTPEQLAAFAQQQRGH